MKMAHVEFALIGVVFLALLLVAWFLRRRQNGLLLQYFSADTLEKIAEEPKTRLTGLRIALHSIAWPFLILALTGPLLGERTREVKTRGTDILIALDISNSMMAQDIQPSRIEKAKLEIRSLLNQLQGDRVGLIVFENDAFLQCPLTTDYAAIQLYLDAITTGYLPNPGTNLAAPVFLASDAFSRTLSVGESDTDSEKSRLLVIMSDGEDHEGGLADAVQFATENRIQVYTIGVGTTAGGPIPVKNRFGKVTDFKRDRQGNVVTTQLKESTMADLADKAGGEYFRISATQSDFYKLAEVIRGLKKTDYQSQEVLDMDNKFQYPLAIALLALMIDLFLLPLVNRRQEIIR